MTKTSKWGQIIGVVQPDPEDYTMEQLMAKWLYNVARLKSRQKKPETRNKMTSTTEQMRDMVSVIVFEGKLVFPDDKGFFNVSIPANAEFTSYSMHRDLLAAIQTTIKAAHSELLRVMREARDALRNAEFIITRHNLTIPDYEHPLSISFVTDALAKLNEILGSE